MPVTHLQGPHQSVCWFRPKRARHFLGEPGSERRHAQDEQRRGGGNSEERREKRGSAQEEDRGGPSPFREGQQVGLVSSSSQERKHGEHSQERDRQPPDLTLLFFLNTLA